MIGELARVGGSFAVTAVAEILGCYLAYLWLRKGGALSLGLFAWLLALHPGPAGRIYAAYGAVYVAAALAWLALVEGQRPDAWDVAGVAVSLAGMAIIVLGHSAGDWARRRAAGLLLRAAERRGPAGRGKRAGTRAETDACPDPRRPADARVSMTDHSGRIWTLRHLIGPP